MLPMVQARGFSGDARRNRPRSRLTGLPGPTYIQGRVLVAIQHQSTAGTDVGADRQAFRHPLQTAAPIGQHATTVLAGVRRRDRDHLTPGACCLGAEDGAKRCPARIADAFGKEVVAHHIRNPQVFEIDRVEPAQQGKRGLVVEVASLLLDMLMPALEQLHRLATALAPLFTATYPTLSSGELLFRRAVATRICDHLPIGGDEKDLQAYVDAGLLSRC